MAGVINKLRMLNLVRKRVHMSTTITVKERIDGWRKQKVRTASVLSELTFNDLKTRIQDLCIAQLDYLSRHIPLAKGFSPEG